MVEKEWVAKVEELEYEISDLRDRIKALRRGMENAIALLLHGDEASAKMELKVALHNDSVEVNET